MREFPQVKPAVPSPRGHAEISSLPEGCYSLTGSPTSVSALRMAPANSGMPCKHGSPALQVQVKVAHGRAET